MLIRRVLSALTALATVCMLACPLTVVAQEAGREEPEPAPHDFISGHGGSSSLLMLLNPTVGRARLRITDRVTWFPEEPVASQSAHLGALQHDFSVAFPLWQDRTHEWSASASVRSTFFDTDARLPDTGQAFPENLWHVRFGTTSRHQCANGWVGSGTLSVSTADQWWCSRGRSDGEDRMVLQKLGLQDAEHLATTKTETMMQKVKAGVVGVGQMGQYHARIYSEFLHVELVGIADCDQARGTAVAEQYYTRAYTDYHDLLGTVDVVSIAVPTLWHYPIARDFLTAGVHVLLEKPIAYTMAEARDLFRLAQARGVVLHIGQVERFNGAVQELKKIVYNPWLIESRRLGPCVPRIKEDGVILDVMIHDIDIILNLVDAPVRQIAALGKAIYSGREDVASVQICFQNGCIANLVASRATEMKIRTMAITQHDAYIVLDYTDQDIRVHRQAASEHMVTRGAVRYQQESLIERIFVHKDNPLKLEIKHLLDCATNGAPRLVSVEDELRALQVALQSLALLEKDGFVSSESMVPQLRGCVKRDDGQPEP